MWCIANNERTGILFPVRHAENMQTITLTGCPWRTGSTVAAGAEGPIAQYGIFVSNASGPGVIEQSYGSNMADAAYYVGACQRQCHATLVRDTGTNSNLGYSGTNAGAPPAPESGLASSGGGRERTDCGVHGIALLSSAGPAGTVPSGTRG